MKGGAQWNHSFTLELRDESNSVELKGWDTTFGVYPSLGYRPFDAGLSNLGWTNSGSTPRILVLRARAFSGNDSNRFADYKAFFTISGGDEQCDVTGEATVQERLGVPSTSVGVGDPVHPATGNFFHQVVDLSSPAGASGLDVVRTYNSLDDSLYGSTSVSNWNLFGRGFATPFDARLVVLDNAAAPGSILGVEYRAGDGRRVLLEPGQSGGFVEPVELRADLTWDPGTEVFTLAYLDGRQARFDRSGRLLSTEEGDQASVAMERDPATGRLVAARAFHGATEVGSLTFGYVGSRVTTITASDGRQVVYGYDPAGQLESVSAPRLGPAEPVHIIESYGWLGGQIEEVWAHRGGGAPPVRKVWNDFDDYQRVEQQLNELGERTTIIYGGLDPSTQTRTTVVAHEAPGVPDETLHYVHDSSGRLLSVVDPYTNVSTRSWDTRDLPEWFESRAGARTASSFDTSGRLLEQFLPDPVTPGVSAGSLSYNWCDPGEPGARVRSVTDASGVVTEFVYDPAATPSTPAGSGDPCVDGVFEPTRVMRGVGTAAAESTFYAWSDGLLASVTGPDGVTRTFSWDPSRRLVSETVAPGTAVEATSWYGYDAAGRRIVSRTPSGVESWSVHDAAGRVVAQVGPVDGPARSCSPGVGCDFGLVPPAGPTVTFEYWLDGSLKSRTDQANRTWAYAVDYPAGGGRIERMTDPDLGVWESVYDAAGRMVAEVAPADPADPAGSSTTTTYEYGPLGRLVRATDPTGVQTHYCYDTDGNTVATAVGPLPVGEQIDCGDPQAGLAVSRTEYDLRGRVRATVDADGYRSVTYYDGERVDRVVGPFKATEVPESAAPVTYYDYDDLGRQRAVDAPGGADEAGAAQRHVVETDFGPGGRVETVTDTATGLSTRRLYRPEDGRLSAVRGPAADPDALGAPETRYGYDADGRVVSVVVDRVCASYPCTPEPGALVTETTDYDPAGRPLRVVDAAGVVREYDWTARGELHRERTAPGTAAASEVEFVSYRFDGQPLVARDALGHETSYGYSTRGERRTRTDAAAGVEEWFYDTAGRLLEHRDEGTVMSWRGYDPDTGRLAVAGDGSARSTEWVYSDAGRPLSATATLDVADPAPDEVSSVSWGYDAFGRRSSMTDGRGTTAFGYDDAGRLTGRVDPAGRASGWGYDPAGRVTTTTTVDGGVFGWEYDPASGRLSAIRQRHRWADTFTAPDGTGFDTYKWSPDNTQNGSVTTEGNAARFDVTNASGAKATLTAVNGAFADGRVDARFRFDDTVNGAHLRFIQRLDGSDHYRVQIQNSNAEVKVWAKNGSVQQNIATFSESPSTAWQRLRFEVEGDRVRVKVWADGEGEPSGWDADVGNNDVTAPGLPSVQFWRNAGAHAAFVDDVAVTSLEGPEPALVAYGWDPQGRVTSEVVAGYPRVWSYVGAQLSSLVQGTCPYCTSTSVGYDAAGRVASTAGAGQSMTFGYDAGSQLTSVVPSSGPAVGVVYDELGRRESVTVGSVTSEYAWGARDELVSVTTGGQSAVFGYDGAGRRVSVSGPGGSERWVYDSAGRLVASGPHDGVAWTATPTGRVYDGDGHLVEVSTANGVSRLDWDVTGPVATPQSVVTGSGTINLIGQGGRWAVGQRGFSTLGLPTDVFGSVSAGGSHNEPFAITGATDVWGVPAAAQVDDPRLGYRGELHIDGLVHLRARDYDPTTGAFLTRDPLDGVDGTPTVANPYHYADNDPANKTDPTGTRAVDADVAVLTTYVCALVPATVATPTPGDDHAGASACFVMVGRVLLVTAVAAEAYTSLTGGATGTRIGPPLTDDDPDTPPVKPPPFPYTSPRTCAAPHTTDPNCADHRGRIQVQGRSLRQELSWAWSGPTPPTAAEGLAGLEGLWQQLPRGERRLLDQAFEQARIFIRHCAPAGCPPPGKNGMANRGVRGTDARVDIEIITGVAFT